MGRDLSRIIVIYIPYAFHRLLAADIVERCLAADELICEHSDAPDIDAVVVALPFDDLWRDIVKSAAIGCSSVRADCRPSEIAQLADILNKVTVTLVMTMF